MSNLLPFAESLFCWQLATYAIGKDCLREKQKLLPNQPKSRRNWLWLVCARSLAAALLMASMTGFRPVGWLLSAVILVAAIALPLTRWKLIPIASLAEFELGANGAVVFAQWLVCIHRPEIPAPIWLPQVTPSQLAALSICAAIFIYTVRGGSFFVRGILEKAGGLPISVESSTTNGGAFQHGAMIGKVERIIVMLIVIVGSYQALAFFFAAKGLIRSKELEERIIADYFLLGSLGSFLLALAAGLVMQRTLAVLWSS
jgi:hypothetical protein